MAMDRTTMMKKRTDELIYPTVCVMNLMLKNRAVLKSVLDESKILMTIYRIEF